MVNLRDEFVIDATFGQLPLGPQLCKRNPFDNSFVDPQTEAVYAVWARGHASCTVDVRNALERLFDRDHGAPNGTFLVRDVLEREGLCAKPAGH